MDMGYALSIVMILSGFCAVGACVFFKANKIITANRDILVAVGAALFSVGCAFLVLNLQFGYDKDKETVNGNKKLAGDFRNVERYMIRALMNADMARNSIDQLQATCEKSGQFKDLSESDIIATSVRLRGHISGWTVHLGAVRYDTNRLFNDNRDALLEIDRTVVDFLIDIFNSVTDGYAKLLEYDRQFLTYNLSGEKSLETICGHADNYFKIFKPMFQATRFARVMSCVMSSLTSSGRIYQNSQAKIISSINEVFAAPRENLESNFGERLEEKIFSLGNEFSVASRKCSDEVDLVIMTGPKI